MVVLPPTTFGCQLPRIGEGQTRLEAGRLLAAMGSFGSSRAWLLTLASSLALAASGCGGPMRSDELGRSIEALGSAAAEGALVAQGVADDRTKTTFVRVRARELGETVDHEGEKLEDASADGEVASAKDRAVDLAGRISMLLGQLQTAPSDRAAAERAGRELRRLAARATQLAAQQA